MVSNVQSDLQPLILDFLEWIAREPRLCADVMDAWRTSCPRLTVWEDAIDRGLAERRHVGGRGTYIAPTRDGMALLTERRLVCRDWRLVAAPDFVQ